MATTLKQLLMKCNPGKNLQGLWITRHPDGDGFRVKWWVTFRDNNGEYQETDPFNAPEDALEECIEVLSE